MNRPRYQPDRGQLWQRISGDQTWDAVIIGGGIVGASILREAIRSGLKVLLLEQRDFAWGTSSRSSKMVHGGLRYIAHGDFKTARDSVRERQRLLQQAPGLIEPLNYLFADRKGKYPRRWLFLALLTVYDLLARRIDHGFLKPDQLSWQVPYWNQDGLLGASQYTDAATDDSRLVLRLLQESTAAGACALNYCHVQTLLRGDDQCAGGRVTGVVARNEVTGECANVAARMVINATGVWADQVRNQVGGEPSLRPLRGSHLVFPAWRLPVFQAITCMHPADQRPVFIYPWEGATVVGTTDLDHEQELSAEPRITTAEVDYLFEILDSEFPSFRLKPVDVISSYAGVRSVVGTGRLNPSAEKRSHSIWDEHGVITVAGGKLTTFRLIARDVLRAASAYLPEFAQLGNDSQVFAVGAEPADLKLSLGADHRRRLLGRYGPEIVPWIAESDRRNLELIPGTRTLWIELQWAATRENIVHLDDLLLRRTRIGLLLPNGATAQLDRIRRLCQQPLGWTDQKWNQEVDRYTALWQAYYSLPDKYLHE